MSVWLISTSRTSPPTGTRDASQETTTSPNGTVRFTDFFEFDGDKIRGLRIDYPARGGD